MTLRRSRLLVFTLGAAAPTGTSPSSDPPPSRPTPANTDARWAAPLGCRTHHRAAPRNRRSRGPRRPSVGIVAELRWSHRIVKADAPMLQDVHGPLPNVVSTDNGEEPEEPVDTLASGNRTAAARELCEEAGVRVDPRAPAPDRHLGPARPRPARPVCHCRVPRRCPRRHSDRCRGRRGGRALVARGRPAPTRVRPCRHHPRGLGGAH